MLIMDDNIELPDEIFRLLRDHIKEYCGMYFDDGSKYMLERRLSRRVKLHQFQTFNDYFHFLTYDRRKEGEMVEVIDCLTTNETYFYREEAQLSAFIDEIVPEILSRKNRSRTLKIWSAGCSSGEEPYTIAMMLMEKGYWPTMDIEIVGSDINQKVLGLARRGVYRRNSFRTMSEALTAKYFTEETPGMFKISDGVKKLVTFSYLNLFDPYKLSFLKDFDIIFCRNVIIYFDVESKKRVIQTFYDKLVPGGYLLLGHAESLLNLTTSFRLVHLKHDMVYQRSPEAGTALQSGRK